VDLSGLVVAGADGPQGISGFLDQRATSAQRSVLEKLAQALFAQGGPNLGPRKFTSATLIHEIKGNDLRLDIAGHGGFTARIILGRDGKTPVIVENNTTWPVHRTAKAKASLAFQDTATGSIQGSGTNANYGAFSFAGDTSDSAKTTTIAPPVAPCCTTMDKGDKRQPQTSEKS
jgi:hypothetical protein